MKINEMISAAKSFENLTYGYEIIHINRRHSYNHEWSDVPYPTIEQIVIDGSDYARNVDGQHCTWSEIFKTIDTLINCSKNPQERYLERFEVQNNKLVVSLGS